LRGYIKLWTFKIFYIKRYEYKIKLNQGKDSTSKKLFDISKQNRNIHELVPILLHYADFRFNVENFV